MTGATRNRHPSTSRGQRVSSYHGAQVRIPTDQDHALVRIGDRAVQLTNLRKPFWTTPLITKGHVLQYYADVAGLLLPHLRDRAMVMKRYPNGSTGDFFFMKRAPSPRPDWINLCSIAHASGNIIDFPVIQNLLSLLWVVNLGCIDLNPWYACCDDVDRPDYLHFDLDPVPDANFEKVCEAALIVHQALDALKVPNVVKTTGSRGMHVYVPIVRGPTQKHVWTFAKQFAQTVAASHPRLLTAEYRIAKRPAGHVLVDYNQNAWSRTLASVYSIRPKPRAPVSMPVTWAEVAAGVRIEDFRIDNSRARLARFGDLWKPLLARRGRDRSTAGDRRFDGVRQRLPRPPDARRSRPKRAWVLVAKGIIAHRLHPSYLRAAAQANLAAPDPGFSLAKCGSLRGP